MFIYSTRGTNIEKMVLESAESTELNIISSYAPWVTNQGKTVLKIFCHINLS